MLRISVHDRSETTTLYVQGKLSGACVDELRRVWMSIRHESPGKDTVVDLCAVRVVDAAGKKLLCQMHGWGTKLAGHGIAIGPLIEEITSTASCSE
jgi:ABC-type transporter Mla MlaB component